MSDAFLYFGDTLKALDDNGRVGGYSVRFTDATRRDLTGEYFTSKTYLGAHEGDGVDVLFHHGMVIPAPPKASASQRKTFEAFSDHIYGTAKSKRDDIGLFTEAVLNLADEYEAAVFRLVKAGKLGWSSASAGHTVRKTSDGEITRWPIIEISLTPTPAEPLNRAVTLKAIESLKFVPLDEGEDDDFDEKPMSEAEKLVSSFKTLDVGTHSHLVVSACRDFGSRMSSRYEARLKAGRVFSEQNIRQMEECMTQLMSVHDRLMGMVQASRPMADAEKRAKETEHFLAKHRHRTRGSS